jgi:hypothetical protein
MTVYEVVIAENQPEYVPLPAIWLPGGTILTHWRCSWRERLRLLWSGDLWVTVLTFNEPLQPLKLDTKCPLLAGMIAAIHPAPDIGPPVL